MTIIVCPLAELDIALARHRPARSVSLLSPGSDFPQLDDEQIRSLRLEFHDIIYASSDHSRVQRVWKSLRSQVSFFLHTRNVAFPDFATVGHPEHLEVRTALSLADPTAARAAVEKHMSGAYVRLKKLALPDREQPLNGGAAPRP